MGTKMSYEQATQKVAQTATHPRVTKEDIEHKIETIEYQVKNQTTICYITMKNGFVCIGHSTPASAENYDTQVGETFAHENAFRQLWQLEGYLLCEKLRGDLKHQMDPTRGRQHA
jgi:Phage protein (N4 Gp49/phage Sf6 gene 66) family